MKDIEKMLENVANKEVQIPPKIQYRIQNTLQNKNKKSWKTCIKKLATAVASAIIVFVGGITVYAAFGGTILGRPVFKWATNMKFSGEYEEYKVEVQGEHVSHNQTTMELVSTICDDCYVLLEFDVKFSEEDKKLMKLGENYITEKDFENLEQEDDEMMKQHLFKHYTEYKNDINTFYVEFQDVSINDKWTWLGKTQTVTKVSDYEYKLYHILFITDQNWNGENQFKLTLKQCFINTDTMRLSGEYGDYKLHTGTSGSGGCFYMDGEINVDVSKEKALENTRVIITEVQPAKYKHMAKTVEKVEITPMQIIVRVSTEITNVSHSSLANSRNKDHIGITNFEVYGDDGQKLTSTAQETKRTITYADGTVEQWHRGDIGTYKSFYNATMNLEEIIIIEKKADINNLKIVPTVDEITYTSPGSSERNEEEIVYGEFNIKLKD